MKYQQAEDYIFSYTDYEKAPMPHDPAFYDLRRVVELLARLDNPHLGAKSIHIAGTNGKGSTAAMVASTLTISGYTTGLYTSPHLHTWRERMRVNGELISEKEFVSLVERLKPEVETVNRKATYGELTTFELLTALGFSYFTLKGVDFQVLEVGLGGKFDATSVINPEVCIITSISFDHMDILGTTLIEIAGEKVGIIKPGSVVVTSPQCEEVDRVIDDACLNNEAKLVRTGRDVTLGNPRFDGGRQLFQIEGRLDNYELSIPLLGQHQMDNAATAVAALEILVERGFNISVANIIDGLAQVSWPGRLQILSHNPLLVVDGAHNVDSARRLTQSLEQYFSFERAILIMGASYDKDIADIALALFAFFDRVIVTRSRHPRTMAPQLLKAEFAKYGVTAQMAEDVSAALSQALDLAGDRDLICITGSLFVVAEAIEQVNKLQLAVGLATPP
ncbi:bifunctional folylpolyglutamate synthase/dihydrofolate synthase [Chloroflexota bacterium]